MATPAYQGANQPPADNGGSLFGRLGSFFGGGGTPSYAGLGQPSGNVGALGSAPAYAQAPVTPPKDAQATQQDPKATTAALAPRACPIDPLCCPIDPAALAAGQIAIVVPRERFACAEAPSDPTAE